jgi:hypothetical protein
MLIPWGAAGRLDQAFRAGGPCEMETETIACGRVFIAKPRQICSYEHMRPSLLPPTVTESLRKIERSVRRFRTCYDFGAGPESLLTEEIIAMRIELLKLWSLVASKGRPNINDLGNSDSDRMPQQDRPRPGCRNNQHQVPGC